MSAKVITKIARIAHLVKSGAKSPGMKLNKLSVIRMKFGLNWQSRQ